MNHVYLIAVLTRYISRYVAKFTVLLPLSLLLIAKQRLTHVFSSQTQIPRELFVMIIWALKGNVKFNIAEF